MKVGTKSVLFGAHCFFLHPWFVAWGWWRCYGFPWDPRLWVAFVVHDLGYFGKPNMDGPEGELHPYWGASVMGALFGHRWFDLALYHSRFLAKRQGAQYSRLCVADKMAIVLTPAWLYLPMTRATGEILEYRKLAADPDGKYAGENRSQASDAAWYDSMREYVATWVHEHLDGRHDTMTLAKRTARDTTGVWQ